MALNSSLPHVTVEPPLMVKLCAVVLTQGDRASVITPELPTPAVLVKLAL